MNVTYTAGWLTLWRGLFYMTSCHPHRLYLIPFLLSPLPFLVWLGSGFLTAIGVIGAWAGFWIGFLLFAIAGSAVMQAGKPCTTLISEGGLRDESWPRQTIINWPNVINIVSTQNGIFLFRRGFFAATFLPVSAFADPREAHQFCDLAVSYWQTAKFGLPLSPQDDAGVWPPAPRK